MDANRFRDAMRLTASGVAVITTDGSGGKAGVTVSSLSSLSMEPPSVILCIHKDARVLSIMRENGVFAANVLAQQQWRVADAFAGLIPELRDNRFAVAQWQTLTTAAPALEEATCSFDCTLATTLEFGSHVIIVGEVIDLRTAPSLPLVFSDRSYRQLTQFAA